MLTLCEPRSESGVIAVDVDNVSYYYLFVKKKNKLFLKPRPLLAFRRSDLYSDGSRAISKLVFVPKPDGLGPIRRCVDFFFAILAAPD